jgi:DNA-binding transcriptional LysR family regulator
MTALLAFESVARLKSVTAAAKELCRTQSAISRQISTLEEQLGVRLFNRVKQQLLLTDQGARYHRDVCRILEDLHECTVALSPQRKTRRSLCLSVGSGFCDRWLIHRLPGFGALHPDIDISMSIARALSDLEMERVDILIGTRHESAIETRNEPLIAERLILVGATGRYAGLEETTPILQHALRKGDWPRYLSARHGDAITPASSLVFDKFNAIIQAVTMGAGIALVPDFMVERELADAVLELLDPEPFVTGFSYDLSFPTRRNRNKAVDDFVSWIREEAAPYGLTETETA